MTCQFRCEKAEQPVCPLTDAQALELVADIEADPLPSALPENSRQRRGHCDGREPARPAPVLGVEDAAHDPGRL